MDRAEIEIEPRQDLFDVLISRHRMTERITDVFLYSGGVPSRSNIGFCEVSAGKKKSRDRKSVV